VRKEAESEDKLDFYPTIHYTSGEMQVNGVNFSVHIPNELRAREVEIKALIEAYKIASKRYIIIYE